MGEKDFVFFWKVGRILKLPNLPSPVGPKQVLLGLCGRFCDIRATGGLGTVGHGGKDGIPNTLGREGQRMETAFASRLPDSRKNFELLLCMKPKRKYKLLHSCGNTSLEILWKGAYS